MAAIVIVTLALLLLALVGTTTWKAGSALLHDDVESGSSPFMAGLPFPDHPDMYVANPVTVSGLASANRSEPIGRGIQFIMSNVPDDPLQWKRFNVLATAAGRACVDLREGAPSSNRRWNGWDVWILHPNGFRTMFRQLDDLEVHVPCSARPEEWQPVLPGDKLGMAGTAARRDVHPLLQFELYGPAGDEVVPFSVPSTGSTRIIPVSELGCGQQPYMVVCPPRGMRRYLTNVATEQPAELLALDASARRGLSFATGSTTAEVLDLNANQRIGSFSLPSAPVAAAFGRDPGRVYVASADSSTVFAIDSDTNATVWMTPVTIPKGVLIDNLSHSVLVLSDFRLTKLDVMTGTVIATLDLHSYCSAFGVRANIDQVIVSTHTGSLLVISIAAMQIVREIPVSPGRALTSLWIDGRTGDMVVGARDEQTLRVIRGETNIQTVSLPGAPLSVTGNGRAGRVYVLVQNAGERSSVVIVDLASSSLIGNIDDPERIAAVVVDSRTSRLLLGFADRHGVRVFRD